MDFSWRIQDSLKIMNLFKLKTIWIPYVAGALLAFFAPLDIEDQFPLWGEFVRQVSAFVPAIEGYAKYSSFPQVTKSYFVFFFIVGVFLCNILFKNPDLVLPNRKKAIERFKNFQLAYLIFGSAISLGLCIVSLLYSGRPWNIFPIHESRLALALIGPLFAWLPFWMFATFVAIFKTWKSNS